MSRYAGVELAPPIEVFNLTRRFDEDWDPRKVNLGVGAFRSGSGRPWVLPVVRKVERMMAEDESLDHEYLPVLGLESCTRAATRLLLGPGSPSLREGRATGIQCLSGTGSVRIGAEFLAKTLKYTVFYCPKPTWDGRLYRYWDTKRRIFDDKGMLEDLSKAPENAVIILHGAGHNPTGIDPTPDQWLMIARVLKEKRLYPFFDCAYQGFASGNFDRDAFAVRLFDNMGFEFIAAQSLAKNFGLYNERIGNLVIVAKNSKTIPKIRSQITLLIRAMYSNPPHHGARIVSIILNNPALFEELQECLTTMSGRIASMRKELRDRLERLGTPVPWGNDWSHITTQTGMFSFTGLTEVQCQHLIEDHHIYLLRNGRINVCGLNFMNLDYVAQSMDAVIRMYPKRYEQNPYG